MRRLSGPLAAVTSAAAVSATCAICSSSARACSVARSRQCGTSGIRRRIVGETRTDASHAELRSGSPMIEPRIARQLDGAPSHPDETFPYVVFCAPPGGNPDYTGAVQRAAKRARAREGDGDGDGGTFIFTSSGGVYADPPVAAPRSAASASEPVVLRERSPTATVGQSDRIAGLLAAEQAAMEAGGTVVRLAGLYTLHRGAHSYWLRHGKAGGPADGLINLVSYDDAARAVLAALERRVRGEVLLVADGSPMTRREICESARKSRLYAGYPMPTFLQDAGARPPPKRYDNAYTRKVLGNWRVIYPSFDAFMERVAEQERQEPEQQLAV